jgi:hypothetical protein
VKRTALLQLREDGERRIGNWIIDIVVVRERGRDLLNTLLSLRDNTIVAAVFQTRDKHFKKSGKSVVLNCRDGQVNDIAR